MNIKNLKLLEPWSPSKPRERLHNSICEPRFSNLPPDNDVEAPKLVLPLALVKTHSACVGVRRVRVDAIVLHDIEEGAGYIAAVAAVVSKPHGAVHEVLGTEGD